MSLVNSPVAFTVTVLEDSLGRHLFSYPSSLKSQNNSLLILKVVVLVAVSLFMCLCESVGSYVYLPL